MKERFGRPKGPSKEDIEREAERELARLTRNAPGPSTGGGLGGPDGGMGTPLDEIASSVRRGRPSAPEPNLGVLGSIGGGPGGHKSGAGEFDRGLGGYGGPSARRGGGAAEGPAPGLPADFEDPEEERATITELALRDLAARDGTSPDDLVIRQDPGMAEAMRDEAMRRFFDRQQTRQPVASTPPIDPANTVLGRLAARRKAEEEGRTLDEDDAPSGGGLLDRVRQRQEAEAAEAKRPSGRRAESGGPLGDRRGGKGAYEVDDDDDDGPAGLRARVRARRRDEINAENRPGRVFAMPFVDDAAQEPGPDPELAAIASRLYEARAKTAGRGSGRGGGAKKAKKRAPAASAPTRARKAKPAAKAAAKRAGGSGAAAKVTKAAGGARAASSRRAPAVKSAAGKTAGKAAAGKASAKEKSPGTRRAAGASRTATVRSSAARSGGATSPAKRATKAPAKRATKAPAKRAIKATKAAGPRASRRR